jgi:hypothetical protein
MTVPCSNELGHRRDYCNETHAPRFDIIIEEIYNLTVTCLIVAHTMLPKLSP